MEALRRATAGTSRAERMVEVGAEERTRGNVDGHLPANEVQHDWMAVPTSNKRKG